MRMYLNPVLSAAFANSVWIAIAVTVTAAVRGKFGDASNMWKCSTNILGSGHTSCGKYCGRGMVRQMAPCRWGAGCTRVTSRVKSDGDVEVSWGMSTVPCPTPQPHPHVWALRPFWMFLRRQLVSFEYFSVTLTFWNIYCKLKGDRNLVQMYIKSINNTQHVIGIFHNASGCFLIKTSSQLHPRPFSV